MVSTAPSCLVVPLIARLITASAPCSAPMPIDPNCSEAKVTDAKKGLKRSSAAGGILFFAKRRREPRPPRGRQLRGQARCARVGECVAHQRRAHLGGIVWHDDLEHHFLRRVECGADLVVEPVPLAVERVERSEEIDRRILVPDDPHRRLGIGQWRDLLGRRGAGEQEGGKAGEGAEAAKRGHRVNLRSRS